MNFTEIYSKDTKKIEKTYAFMQKLNLIICSILAFALLALTIIIALDDEILWLAPLVALAIVVVVFFANYNALQIKYGMYYDIRKTRMATENGDKKAPETFGNALPEL